MKKNKKWKQNYLENIGKTVFNIVSANKRVITEKHQEKRWGLQCLDNYSEWVSRLSHNEGEPKTIWQTFWFEKIELGAYEAKVGRVYKADKIKKRKLIKNSDDLKI